MIAEITARQGQLSSRCERYGVLRLDLFGSAARGGFGPTASDEERGVASERDCRMLRSHPRERRTR